jgi:hypothetical protein
LLEGLGRPADVIALTAAEWEARAGTALHREATMRWIQLYPAS